MNQEDGLRTEDLNLVEHVLFDLHRIKAREAFAAEPGTDYSKRAYWQAQGLREFHEKLIEEFARPSQKQRTASRATEQFSDNEEGAVIGQTNPPEAQPEPEKVEPRCSFCGRPEPEAGNLVLGNAMAYICPECTWKAAEVFDAAERKGGK